MSTSLLTDEHIVIRSLVTIHAAQMTYASTYGNGNYAATLEALRQAELIDPVLASGYKYGFTFVMSATPASRLTPATFVVSATPQRYPHTGKRSFFVDTFGEIRGGDKKGRAATASDPYIDTCALLGSADNESCAINAMRTLHGAEMTYASTYGNGNYGTLSQMGRASLINRTLATGLIHGYSFTVTFVTSTQTAPASFKINATPQIYGTTGVRSFFMDINGVVNGSDKQGKPAAENDPAIDLCSHGSISENEQCTIYSLQTLHDAELKYLSTYTNGISYASLAELARVELVDVSLGSGQLRGYSFSVLTSRLTLSGRASFKISATPKIYGTTGIRSFFMDESGVIRGADKKGLQANENDPPIEP
ncbi:MAG: hypothetical protein ACKVRN_02185 [Pyrinomonadaceae bacterium]